MPRHAQHARLCRNVFASECNDLCRERFETVPYTPPPCRLDIIIDLEMV